MSWRNESRRAWTLSNHLRSVLRLHECVVQCSSAPGAAALERIGSGVKHLPESHPVQTRDNAPDSVFAFHDREEIGARERVTVGLKGN